MVLGGGRVSSISGLAGVLSGIEGVKAFTKYLTKLHRISLISVGRKDILP